MGEKMKKLVAIALILPMVIGGMSPGIAAGENLQNVDIGFENGYGIRIGVLNGNDYPIYDIHLKTIFITGLVFGGSSGITNLQEIEAGKYGYLVTPIFGIGTILVSAVVSYEDQGEYVERQINANLFVIGTMVIGVDEW